MNTAGNISTLDDNQMSVDEEEVANADFRFYYISNAVGRKINFAALVENFLTKQKIATKRKRVIHTIAFLLYSRVSERRGEPRKLGHS